MEWLIALAFVATWYLASKEIEKLQSRQMRLEEQVYEALKDIEELKRKVNNN